MVALNAVIQGLFKGTLNGTLQGSHQLAYRIIFPENFDRDTFFTMDKLDSIWWFQEYGTTYFEQDEINITIPSYIDGRWEDCKQSRLNILSSVGAKIIIRNNTSKKIIINCGSKVTVDPNTFYYFELILDTTNANQSQLRWKNLPLIIEL